MLNEILSIYDLPFLFFVVSWYIIIIIINPLK